MLGSVADWHQWAFRQQRFQQRRRPRPARAEAPADV